MPPKKNLLFVTLESQLRGTQRAISLLVNINPKGGETQSGKTGARKKELLLLRLFYELLTILKELIMGNFLLLFFTFVNFIAAGFACYIYRDCKMGLFTRLTMMFNVFAGTFSGSVFLMINL